MLNSTIEHYLADKWAERSKDKKYWKQITKHGRYTGSSFRSGRVHPLLVLFSTSLNEVASAGLSFDVANSLGQPHSIKVIVR